MGILQRKVLVVDDDPVIGRSFQGVLSGKGYAVITARDGEEALHKLNYEKYDMVFTDIKMPGMSGLEVAERIKAKQPWLPVVIITGFGSDANIKRAQAAGVTEFLQKPLSPEMIEGSAERAGHERDAAPASETGATETAEITETQPQEIPTKEDSYFIQSCFGTPFAAVQEIVQKPLDGLKVLAERGMKDMLKKGTPSWIATPLKNIVFTVAAIVIETLNFAILPIVGFSIFMWKLLSAPSTLFDTGSATKSDKLNVEHIKTAPEPKLADTHIEPALESTARTVDTLKTDTRVVSDVENVAMFFAAPLVGLIYVITFPFMGLGVFAYMVSRELIRIGISEKTANHIKNILMFFLAPFVGLAYALAFPFVGIGVLVRMLVERLMK